MPGLESSPLPPPATPLRPEFTPLFVTALPLLAVEIVPLLVTAPPFVLEIAAGVVAVAAPGVALMPFVVAPTACEFGPVVAPLAPLGKSLRLPPALPLLKPRIWIWALFFTQVLIPAAQRSTQALRLLSSTQLLVHRTAAYTHRPTTDGGSADAGEKVPKPMS